MKPIIKFQLFWWALCCAITIAYALNDGWSSYHVAGAVLYAALFIFEYVWERRRMQREAAWKKPGDGGKTWNQRVADGDI